MNVMSRRARACLAALGMSLMVVGAMPVTVAAFTPLDLTFRASPGPCVGGTSNKTVDIELHDSSDTLLDKVLAVDPDAHGRFRACFATGYVTSGLTLVGISPTDIDQTRFTIPALSLAVDRVGNVVKGRARAGSHVALRADRCDPLQACHRVLTRTVTSDGSGRYRTDTSSTADLKGGDLVRATLTSHAGHTYTMFQAAPIMDILVGGQVYGQVDPGQDATFRLRSGPGGTLLSTRHVTGLGYGGNFHLTFGATIKAGRQVISDFASDARVTIPEHEHHDHHRAWPPVDPGTLPAGPSGDGGMAGDPRARAADGRLPRTRRRRPLVSREPWVPLAEPVGCQARLRHTGRRRHHPGHHGPVMHHAGMDGTASRCW